MKIKFIPCLLAAILLFSLLSACNEPPPAANSSEESESSSTPETSKSWDELAEKFSTLRIDGSTSTIPLEVGLRQALLGIDKDEAGKQVLHTTTHQSLDRLLNGEVDIVMTVPLSAEQRTRAAEKGITPELVPIAMEGFVFVVNKDNPVETLTQQQIKDIYSGKIKNWKEVGGNDAPIAAYQRNQNSGSQNYMNAFMGETALMEPITTTIPGTMSGLMDIIASYDNGLDSIGYSVYSYAAEMYAAANNVRFIQVDGIKPEKTTLEDGSYPLLSYTYAIIDSAKKNDVIRMFLDWLASEEGQKVVAETGYIPVTEIGSGLETSAKKPFSNTGTGIEKPVGYTLPGFDFKPVSFFKMETLTSGGVSILKQKPQITGLSNTQLQNEINRFIDNAIEEIESNQNEAKDYANAYLEDQWYPLQGIGVQVDCQNGFLSAMVSYVYTIRSWMSPFFYKPMTAVWDLYSGKRLEFSDLFWQDTPFIDLVNNEVKTQLSRLREEYGGDYIQIGDFWFLPADFTSFSLDSVYLASKEGVFPHGQQFTFDTVCEEMLVTNQTRDMKGLWEEKVAIQPFYRDYQNFEVANGVKYDHFDALWLLDAKKSGIEERICNQINTHVKNQIDETISRNAMNKKYKRGYGNHNQFNNVSLHVFGGYAFYHASITAEPNDEKGNPSNAFEYNIFSKIYNLKTGNTVELTQLFKGNWRSEIQWQDKQPASIETLLLYGITQQESDGRILINAFDEKGQQYVQFTVPAEYFVVG